MEDNTQNQQVNAIPATMPSTSQTPSPSPKSKLPLILGGVLLLLLVGGGGYYLGTQKNTHTQVTQYTQQSNTAPVVTSEPSPTNNPPNNSDWKTFTSTSAGITLKYPSTWVTPENTFISEKTFVPGEQDRSKTYNIIEIQKYSTQIYQGYTNSAWFDKMTSLKSPSIDGKLKRTNIGSGTVSTGEQYVLLKDEPSPSAQTEYFNQIRAYIIKGQILYQLTLDSYDQNGLETFKKIVPTASVN